MIVYCSEPPKYFCPANQKHTGASQYNANYTNKMESPGPMRMDPVLACLLITLGAMIAYAADERFLLTKRLNAWIERVFEN